MKPSTAVLTASLLANGALVIALCFGRTTASVRPPRQDANASVETARVKTTTAGSPAPSASWARLSGDGDLAGLVVRLRAADYPPDLVREIIKALVSDRFNAERYRIDTAALHTPYWQMWPNSYADPKTGPELRRINREERDLIRQLLGESSGDARLESEEGRAMLQQRLGNFEPEKLERLNAYLAATQEKRMRIFAESGNGRAMLPADREKLVELEKETRRGLAEFLTPDEVNEFNLRSSDAAGRLQWMLAPLSVTENEYRTIFPLYQAFLDQFPNMAFGRPPTPEQTFARDAMLAQIASSVGTARADELKQAIDPRYMGINQLARRLDLPLAAAKQVVTVQDDTMQRAAALRQDASLTAGERADRLAQLAQEAASKLSTALGGQRGLDAYRQFGGQWLSALSPPNG